MNVSTAAISSLMMIKGGYPYILWRISVGGVICVRATARCPPTVKGTLEEEEDPVAAVPVYDPCELVLTQVREFGEYVYLMRALSRRSAPLSKVELGQLREDESIGDRVSAIARSMCNPRIMMAGLFDDRAAEFWWAMRKFWIVQRCFEALGWGWLCHASRTYRKFRQLIMRYALNLLLKAVEIDRMGMDEMKRRQGRVGWHE
jgi:hypothetical protein